MAAKAMRNIQVPAYCPIDFGIQERENKGVVVDVKKVMAIAFIPIISSVDDMSIAPVELGIAIPDIALVGVPDVDIVMPSISIDIVYHRRFVRIFLASELCL